MNRRLLISPSNKFLKHLYIPLPLNFSCKTFQSEKLRSSTFPACISLLQSCAQESNLQHGQQIHAHLLRTGLFYSSPLSTTSLINMYSKSSTSVSHALSVFLTSPHVDNVFVFNAIIAGLVSFDFPDQAFTFYCNMRTRGLIPDNYTFPCVIKSCCAVVDVKKIHGLVVKLGLQLDLYVGSALVHSYLKFWVSGDALLLFEELPFRDDVVVFNAMINGFRLSGEIDKAQMVFRSMLDNGVVPNLFSITGILSVFSAAGDVINGRIIHGFVINLAYDSSIAVSNALIDMYGKCKCVSDAVKTFDSMVQKDMFSWNSIICVHEQCGAYDETLRFFRRMLRSHVKPDMVTIASVLPSCARLSAIFQGREIHAHMIVSGLQKYAIDGAFANIYIDNAVMDMYAKCGSLKEASLIFNKMRYRDIASWNIMIMGYGMYGFAIESLDMFRCMSQAKLKPNEITFIGVLSACSHAGFVSQGQEFFVQMLPIYGIMPTIEHYACIIDMLGRGGKLDEAYNVLLTMPYEANSIVWRTFMAAAQLHGNSDLANIAAQRVFELEPEHCGSYVILSNMYGASGQYDKVLGLRYTMRQQNVKKSPGCSWIELSDGAHVFVNHDRNHPQDLDIYAELESLTACLRGYGYIYLLS